MKRFILSLILTGLSVSAFAKDQPVDIDCQKMANNAKAFAQLKATGIAKTPEQFASFVVSPVVQTYPIQAILQYVFAQKDQTPEQVYAALYGRCTVMGYQDLFSYFTDREATAKVQNQLDIANATVAALQVENQKLVYGYNNIREQLLRVQSRKVAASTVAVPAPARAYGAPVSAPLVNN